MHKIYGITQGEQDIDLSEMLPGRVERGTIGRMGCYMWCIKYEKTALLVDTGMTDEDAKFFFRMPGAKCLGGQKYIEAKLKELDVYPAEIEIVIVSHLHFDHFSAHQLYPKASFYIQKKDIEFYTGPGVRFQQIRHGAANIPEVVSLAWAKRIRYVDGNEQIIPGVRVVLVGGHTPGTQVVVVTTSRGDAVICSDSLDFYQQLEEDVTRPSVNLMESLLARDKIRALASSPELIIPGHDALAMKKFPSPIEGVIEIG
jgi:glyoxylase-like metal-dependent hydrolase (beta-lactamase superfamily II)